MDPLFPALLDFAGATLEELDAFLAENGAAIESVGAAPLTYVTEELTSAQILEQMQAAVDAQAAARAAHAQLTADAELEGEPVVEENDDDDEDDEDDAFAAEVASLAAQAREPEVEPELVEPEAVEEPTPIVAAAPVKPARQQPPARLRPPARSRRSAHRDDAISKVAMTAAGGPSIGMEMSARDVAQDMIDKREQFGHIPSGTRGERYPVAKASWKDRYPDERRFTGNSLDDAELIAAALDPAKIKAEIRRRRKEGFSMELTAAAATVLCAPVTPYYGLADISTGVRPVRAMLPSFGADRGGLRYARPASLADVADIGLGIGVVTAEQDAEGGTDAIKSVLTVDCPDWEEKATAAIYRQLQFKNRLQRTFPELVAQWTSLAMSAQARLAESRLLTGIDNASTEVVAGNLGLGASATLFNQYLAAANGLRNRHRTDPEAVLRLAIPDWTVDMIISDVIRSQFERFDTDEDRVAALFRSFDIEPAFYIDSAFGRGQVFGVQNAGPLLPFPDTVAGYMYVEGSHLFLDGGTLEVGVVRDSVLNATNDYQLFSETFEETAFIGVESLVIISDVCDSGVVAAPGDMTGLCPIDYAVAS